MELANEQVAAAYSVVYLNVRRALLAALSTI